MNGVIRICSLILIVLLLASCADKPVRHLASDASLIKPGSSTKADVLTFLGDPDAQQMVSDTAERWVYYEEKKTTMQKTPYVGGLFGDGGYNRILVTFEGDLVISCKYSSFDSDEYDWADDHDWQENTL
ncbi:MAG: hypothetical protein D6B25_10630 [Desulfobulbaceae bacterium]|nr:MAG: hypothetical protein D6B25_10630 [Desulfobulbaceae bacterium]